MLAKTPELRLGSRDFAFFCEAILRLAGISFSEVKFELVQARLRPRLHGLGLGAYGDYRAYLEALPDSHPEWQVFINLLTTNKTDWFREPEHFDFLVRRLVPSLRAKLRRPVRIWCAACSTGEEAYTLSMVLRAHFGPDFRFEILATDLDTEVLKIAENGVYRRQVVAATVPPRYLDEAFAFGTAGIADWAKVRTEVREPVSFAQLNLVRAPYRLPWAFDVAFCRNVLIYFARDTVQRVTESLFEAAGDEAALMIGHSESLSSLPSRWRFVAPSVYVKGKSL